MTSRERKMSTIEGRVSKSSLSVEGPGGIISTRISDPPASKNKMEVKGDDIQATKNQEPSVSSGKVGSESAKSDAEKQQGSVNTVTSKAASSSKEVSSNLTNDPPELEISGGVSDTRSMKDRARRRSTAVTKPGAVAVVGDTDKEQTKTSGAPLTHAPPEVGTLDGTMSASRTTGVSSIPTENQAIKDRNRRLSTDIKPGAILVNSEPLSHALPESEPLSEARSTAARNDSVSSTATDIQMMKDRARRRSTAVKPGVIAISEATLNENVPASRNGSISSTASDLQAMKNRARRRSTVEQPGAVPVAGLDGSMRSQSPPEAATTRQPRGEEEIDVPLAQDMLPPGAYHTMEDDLHAKQQKDWVDPMLNGSRPQFDPSDLPAEKSNRELDAYTQYAETPEFTRYTLTLPDERTNAANSTDGSHMSSGVSRTPSIQSDGTLNAPVQHFSSWQEDEEHKSRWDTGFHLNRVLCTAGVVLILVVVGVVVGVSVALTSGGGSAQSGNDPTSAPVDNFPTAKPVPECASAGDTLDQSDRVVRFTQLLGESAPNSAQRQAICWLADEDQLQLDPLSQGSLEQRFAMSVFYFSTTPNEDDGLALSNWMNGESECTWLGVTCDNDQVKQLELISEALAGTLPPELELLSRLTVFTLGITPDLTGEIPDGIYGISTLTTLALEANELQGTISSRIGELTELEILRIGKTRMNGTLPSELFSLSVLGQLMIADNAFVDTIPTEIGTLSNLYFFVAQSNMLSGSLPTETGLCTALEVLALNYNPRLAGTIPTELGSLTALSNLQLEFTGVTGTMPTEVCALRSLELVTLTSDCEPRVDCPCCTDCF